MTDPHPWLGRDFRDLLPGLRAGQFRFTLSLTRPRGQAWGSGVLRVVAVRESADLAHCVLSYEHYHWPPRRPGSEKKRGLSQRAEGGVRG